MTKKVEHWYQSTHIGPNIIIQCSCGWSICKNKALSDVAAKAARAHYVVVKPPRDKYEEMSRRLQPVHGDEVFDLKHKHNQERMVTGGDDPVMLHGGGLRHQTPRTGKYRGLNVDGIKLK